ncbi:MAG: hypothetical protein A2Y94_08705 [Caldithrix sp. RBG_13_44_9]|nr:MAG: hypothetical protein A2Y94_08705 [Caldithrix sp. RBG_13_44_9]
MNNTFLKEIESSGKQLLLFLGGQLLRRKNKLQLSVKEIKKILVFRLDQRVGNGMMLLPLLRAIRQSLPDVQLHLLLHQPVLDIYQKFSVGIIDQYWPYQQDKLLLNPILFFSWLKALRQQKYDLIISSHNPDNFSISQVLLGWWCRPKILMGFSWGESKTYYDLAVESSSAKHYADSQLDLWRFFDPAAELVWGGLRVSPEETQKVAVKYALNISKPSILLWLGATGKKVLPPNLITFLLAEISKNKGLEILLALGPDDQEILPDLPPDLQKKVMIWKHPLSETLAFFAGQKAFISGDTGPAHLVAALGLPMLTIFVSSKKQQYGYHDGSLRFAVSYDGSAQKLEKIAESIKILTQAITHEINK